MRSVQANRGRALEDLLEAVFASLDVTFADAVPGAKMFRQSNKWVPLRSGGAFPHKGAPVDFVGVIMGIPVALECKETAASTFSLHPSKFPEKEIRSLQVFSQAGGRAFVIIAFWKVESLAVFKFETLYGLWLKCQEGGRASLRPGDADAVILAANVAVVPALLVNLAAGKQRPSRNPQN